MHDLVMEHDFGMRNDNVRIIDTNNKLFLKKTLKINNSYNNVYDLDFFDETTKILNIKKTKLGNFENFFFFSGIFFKIFNLLFNSGKKSKTMNILLSVFQLIKLTYSVNIFFFFFKILYYYRVPMAILKKKKSGKIRIFPKLIKTKYQYNMLLLLLRKNIKQNKKKFLSYYHSILYEFLSILFSLDTLTTIYLKNYVNLLIEGRENLHFRKKNW